MRVFLSSPSDVKDDRDAVVRAITALSNGLRDELVIQPVYWDMLGAEVPMSATSPPQDSVTTYQCLPRECDLTIVLLWSRLGTPMPKGERRKNGDAFSSGTVWELEDALEGGKEVFIYRCKREPTVGLDDPLKAEKEAQYALVKGFIANGVAPDGSALRGMSTYEDRDSLEKRIANDLRTFIDKRWRRARQATVVTLPRADVLTSDVGTVKFDGDWLRRLLRLCGHQRSIDDVTDAVRDCLSGGPRHVVGCILPGFNDRGHDGLPDRLHDPEIRQQVGRGVLSRKGIELLKITKELNWESASTFEKTLVMRIREKSDDLSGAKDLPEIAKRLSRKCRIVILYAYLNVGRPASELERKEKGIQEDQVLRVFSEALKRLPATDPRLSWLLMLGLRYPAPTGVWPPGDQQKVDGTIQLASQQLAQMSREWRDAHPELVVLDPLALIDGDDTERWQAEERTVRPSLRLAGLSKRVEKSLQALHEKAKAWPKDPLADNLVEELGL